MRFNKFENGCVDALLDTGKMISGCLDILSMAEKSLDDVEGCSDIQGSLHHCQLILQLMLPEEDNGVCDYPCSECQAR
jgi:hypothetical protein